MIRYDENKLSHSKNRECMLSFNYFGISDVGRVRVRNEDFWYADKDQKLFVVADGMGGHLAGDVASKEAVFQLLKLFKEKNGLFVNSNLKKCLQELALILSDVNSWIYGKGSTNLNLMGMGTTLSSLHFYENYGFIGHVGDSRIYRMRKGTLKRLTEDHSLVRKLVNSGVLTEDKISHFPYKHVLTNVIGSKPSVKVDVTSIKTDKDDLFLLCSDGLNNAISDQELSTILSSSLPLEKIGERLIWLANNRGGYDNITVLLVKAI